MRQKYAQFYKCALQVNPYSYISYRGETHITTEEEYNQAILDRCLQNGIRVIGLADHGDSQSSEKLRGLLSDNNITVFPGFEIATAEKIHVVCLFHEDTDITTLNRYLGKLGLTDTNDGIAPSNLSCADIARIVVDELHGFWYAAHVTSDNGILKIGQMQHLWRNEYLLAAQIPSSRENIDPKYKNIINNKEPEYKRNNMIAYINAKDVSKPDELGLPESSCLVKMSNVNFDCFKQAFRDPDSRVKLVTELAEQHHSVIEKIQIFGGYLDGLNVELSPHLNSFIGGRGTGKSTLLELIRYAVELEPKSESTQKTVRSLMDSNLGDDKGRIELILASNKEHGKKYKILKRYDEPAIIKDLDDNISNLKISDILPAVEIYGQNEIIEIIEDETLKLQILDRFLPNQENSLIQRKSILSNLERNRNDILEILDDIYTLEEQVQRLPKLLEQKEKFNEIGLINKLSNIEKISKEEEFLNSITAPLSQEFKELTEIELSFEVSDSPDILHKDLMISAEKIINKLNLDINYLNIKYKNIINEAISDIQGVKEEWIKCKEKVDQEIEKLVKELPEIHGISGENIAKEYQKIVSDITRILPMEKELFKKKQELLGKQENRNTLLEDLRVNKDTCEDELRRIIKKINKKSLKGKIKITLKPRSNRDNLKNFLMTFQGIGNANVEWIERVEDLSIPKLCSEIESGLERFLAKYRDYGLTDARARTIVNMGDEDRLKLQEIELNDIIDIQLNVGTKEEKYKSLEQLSKGQQCTAILNILLLDNKDPLIIDQPEDNLDNAFIANNIVSELREHKMKRQFIFATHNANIPVFGDAELIGVLHEEDGQGRILDDCIGSVDSNEVRQAVIQTLEGGGNAFTMRRAKYNL
ncbi:hypothetical protein COK34_28250 [Bacillus thuringiensis]|uniref:TrlF family AAA-like ATPase n=1 Tax=Bacillus thuringiensis TaxID=1428 RepID=UPI000BF7B3E2|nr:AAA family ATPase [Bacillus thuringiensis]MED2918691.1 hypothetical protein [Bacillus thuringiensis]MED2922828.1 hypothetical protein [Bacillus thuringiensis]MED3051186.1 hypothetical protein [Bacillus thuringiensis]PFR48331.1 hypothetical protein COK34_28250 [Bacillus thuringiensis]